MVSWCCLFLCLSVAWGSLSLRERFRRSALSFVEDSTHQLVFGKTKIFHPERAQSLGTSADVISFYVDCQYEHSQRASHEDVCAVKPDGNGSWASVQFVPRPREELKKKRDWSVKIDGHNVAIFLFDKNRHLIKLHDFTPYSHSEATMDELNVVSISEEVLAEADQYYRGLEHDLIHSFENPQIYEITDYEVSSAEEHVNDPIRFFDYQSYMINDAEAGMTLVIIAPGTQDRQPMSRSKLIRLMAATLDPKEFANQIRSILNGAFAMVIPIHSANRAVRIPMNTNRRVFQHFMATDIQKMAAFKTKYHHVKEDSKIKLKMHLSSVLQASAQVEIVGRGREGQTIVPKFWRLKEGVNQ